MLSCLNARHCRAQQSYILKMKLVAPLVISLLSCSAFAAKKPAASTFETYHARAVASTPISIDDQGYEQVTSAPRDYSVAVLLTALEDKFGCKLCRDFPRMERRCTQLAEGRQKRRIKDSLRHDGF